MLKRERLSCPSIRTKERHRGSGTLGCLEQRLLPGAPQEQQMSVIPFLIARNEGLFDSQFCIISGKA